MFGPSIRTVFTSRWKALMWSVGILLTAYCTVPREGEDTEQASAEQARRAEAMYQAVSGGKASTRQEAKGTNPWAKDKD